MIKQSHIYELLNLPHNLSFPLSLDQVGWMVCHRNPAQTVNKTFVCISFNRRQYSQDAPAEAIMSIFYPGNITTTQDFIHDEIFLSYRKEQAQLLCDLIKGVPYFRQPFIFSPDISALCASMHERLDHLHEPGVVDNLDMLALQLISSCIQAINEYSKPTPNEDMRIYEIAAKLKRGERLDALIRKFNFGRRSFYYAWDKIFKTPPGQYRQDEMLKQAALLLLQTTMQVSEIADSCGFANESCLYRLFKKKHHQTPTQYRNEQNKLP